MVGQPRFAIRGCNESVELILIHDGIDSLGTCESTIHRESIKILLISQWPFRFSHLEKFLLEKRHLTRSVSFVERNHIGKRMHGRLITKPLEIFRQVALQFIEQHSHLAFVKLAKRWNVCRIDDDCAEALQIRNRSFHHQIDVCAVSHKPVTHNAKACAAQSIAIERCGVFALAHRSRFGGDRICIIISRKYAEQNRCVGDSPRHWSCGVLAMRNWNDSRSTDKSKCWLDADQSIVVRRRDD